jgi:hypothetical protein
MRQVWAAALGFGLGVVGCGAGDDTVTVDADVSPDAGISTIRGTSATIFHRLGDTESVVHNLDGYPIAAFRWSDDGAIYEYTGTGTAQGKFSIPDVPETSCVVRFGGFTHVATEHREIDFSDDFPGRADWMWPLPGTTMLFNVDGMLPWADAHELALYSPNLGLYNDFLVFDAPVPPATNDTALVDWETSSDFWPVIDGNRGDRAQLVHYADQLVNVNGDRVVKAMQILEPEPFVQDNGGQTEITGTFSDIPQTESIHLEWAFSTFSAMRGWVHPDAWAPFTADVALYAQPGGVRPTPYTYGPYLLRSAIDDPITNVDLGTLDYGNPFPPDWPLFLVASTWIPVELVHPYDGWSVYAFGYLVYVADLETYGDGPITLPVQPPTQLHVGGKPARGYPGGVGTTPLLSWLAPLNATGYEVLLVHAYETAGEGDYDFVGHFFTAEPELRIPPGILVEGDYYYFIVTALNMPDVDVSETPFRLSMVQGRAEAISGFFVP